MAMKRRPRAETQSAADAACMAAFLGDPCPPDFNPFIFNCFEDVLILGHRQHAEPLQEAWPRIRDQVMREWRRRGRKGPPPGCSLDRTVTK